MELVEDMEFSPLPLQSVHHIGKYLFNYQLPNDGIGREYEAFSAAAPFCPSHRQILFDCQLFTFLFYQKNFKFQLFFIIFLNLAWLTN